MDMFAIGILVFMVLIVIEMLESFLCQDKHENSDDSNDCEVNDN